MLYPIVVDIDLGAGTQTAIVIDYVWECKSGLSSFSPMNLLMDESASKC